MSTTVRGTLLNRFAANHPQELAQSLESAEPSVLSETFGSLRAGEAARVFGYLTPEAAAAGLAAIDPALSASVIAASDPSHVALLVARLDEDHRNTILAKLSAELSKELRELISYPADSAGHLMSPRPFAMHPETTVAQALERLRDRRQDPIQQVCVVDAATKRLLGVVALTELATGDPAATLGSLAQPPAAVTQPLATREEVMESLGDSPRAVLPVVDIKGALVGVVRGAALVHAAQEEASVDLQTMFGADKDERALSPISFAVKKRLPWLQINLGTAFLAASVVSLFEETIASNTALAVLLPVVAGQSGNTGSQALAVVIRALALREIRVRQWLQVCRKELMVGLVNGVAVAVVTAFFVFMWSGSLGLGAVIGCSMIISMTIAGFSGAGVPIILTRLGLDPAQSSSIVLTTVTDVVGFFSFLGIATALMATL